MSQEILGRLDRIEQSVTTLNHEYGEVVTKMASIGTDVGWLKKFFWVIVTASVSAAFMAMLVLVKMLAGG